MNDDCRIEEFEEKPMVSNSNCISTGIYVIRRRQLIELIEHPRVTLPEQIRVSGKLLDGGSVRIL